MGLSQEEFAELCDLSRGGIAKIEGDKNVPNAITLAAIARATEISMEYFVNGLSGESSKEEAELLAALEVVREVHEKLGQAITSLEAIHLPPRSPVRSSRQRNKADEWQGMRPGDSPESTQSGDP